jgi:hypothetical protein
MGEVVYILCSLTSIFCMGLLFRAHRQTRSALSFWSAWCFGFLAINNLLLLLSLGISPETDLSGWRNLSGLTGVSLLLYGFIWKQRR